MAQVSTAQHCTHHVVCCDQGMQALIEWVRVLAVQIAVAVHDLHPGVGLLLDSLQLLAAHTQQQTLQQTDRCHLEVMEGRSAVGRPASAAQA